MVSEPSSPPDLPQTPSVLRLGRDSCAASFDKTPPITELTDGDEIVDQEKIAAEKLTEAGGRPYTKDQASETGTLAEAYLKSLSPHQPLHAQKQRWEGFLFFRNAAGTKRFGQKLLQQARDQRQTFGKCSEEVQTWLEYQKYELLWKSSQATQLENCQTELSQLQNESPQIIPWNNQSLHRLDAFTIALECNSQQREIESLYEAKEFTSKLAKQRQEVALSIPKGTKISHLMWSRLFQDLLDQAQLAKESVPMYPSEDTSMDASDIAQLLSVRAEAKRAFELAGKARDMVDAEKWQGTITQEALVTKIDDELANISEMISKAKVAREQATSRSRAASLLWEIQKLHRKRSLHDGFLRWVEYVVQLLVGNTSIRSIHPSQANTMKRKLGDRSSEDMSADREPLMPRRFIKKARIVKVPRRVDVGEYNGIEDHCLRKGTALSSKRCKRQLFPKQIALEINTESRLPCLIPTETGESIKVLRRSTRIRRLPERFGLP